MSPAVLSLALLLLLGVLAPSEQVDGDPCRNNSDCGRKECCVGDNTYRVVVGNRSLRSVVPWGFSRGTCKRRSGVGDRCYKEWGSTKMIIGDTSPIYPSVCPCATTTCIPLRLPADENGQPGMCSFMKR